MLKRLRKSLRKRFGPPPALVVLSFPKSGRTWHRVMVGYYLTRLAGWPGERAMDLDALCDQLKIGRIHYTHNGANFNDQTASTAPSVADPKEWAGRQVLQITRDPRDVLVSAYHHAVYRKRSFEGSISDFIRGDETGADKLFTALNRWEQNRHLASRFEVISYEEMHDRPEQVLAATLNMIGVAPDRDLLAESVRFASFDNMKQAEQESRFGNVRMRPASDARGNKVREGKVGGFHNHLSTFDLAYITERQRHHEARVESHALWSGRLSKM